MHLIVKGIFLSNLLTKQIYKYCLISYILSAFSFILFHFVIHHSLAFTRFLLYFYTFSVQSIGVMLLRGIFLCGPCYVVLSRTRSSSGVWTVTWQHCETILTRWQRGKEDDNEDDLGLFEQKCLSWSQANACINKQPLPSLGTQDQEVGQNVEEKRAVRIYFWWIWALFMLVPYITVLMCLNQSEPRGARIILLRLGMSVRGIIIYS